MYILYNNFSIDSARTTFTLTTTQERQQFSAEIIIVIPIIAIIVCTVLSLVLIALFILILRKKRSKNELKYMPSKDCKQINSPTVDEGTGQVMEPLRLDEEECKKDRDMLQNKDVSDTSFDTATSVPQNKLVIEVLCKVESSFPSRKNETCSPSDNQCVTDLYATVNKKKNVEPLPEYAVVNKKRNKENLMKESLSFEDMYAAVEKSIPPVIPIKVDGLLENLN